MNVFPVQFSRCGRARSARNAGRARFHLLPPFWLPSVGRRMASCRRSLASQMNEESGMRNEEFSLPWLASACLFLFLFHEPSKRYRENDRQSDILIGLTAFFAFAPFACHVHLASVSGFGLRLFIPHSSFPIPHSQALDLRI